MKTRLTSFHTKPRKPLKKSGFKAKTVVRGKKSTTRQISGKKTPSRSLSKLKKELDRVFSIYIRSKHTKKCYTCPKTDCVLQCGHFVPRQYLATRWSEDNCRPQCVGCNLFGNGQLLDFEENLKRELGVEKVEALKASRHLILKLDRAWYENEIKKFSTGKV